jgi:hypothetical protein
LVQDVVGTCTLWNWRYVKVVNWHTLVRTNLFKFFWWVGVCNIWRFISSTNNELCLLFSGSWHGTLEFPYNTFFFYFGKLFWLLHHLTFNMCFLLKNNCSWPIIHN